MTDPSLHADSVVVAAGRPHDPGAPLSAPIVLAAPWRGGDGRNDYARSEVNQTLAAFEQVLGALEGGTALGFGSGMAAVSAVVEGMPAGSVAVVPDAGYSGMVSIFAEQERLGRMTVHRVDIADTAAVLAALPGADLVWLETVTNPLLAVPDIPALAAAAHEAGARVVVDATFSTPLLARTLDLGADIALHSVTKFLAGHSDVLMGALVTRSAALATQLHDRRTLTGGLPGALETFLATRGMRTLAVRLDRAQANAGTLALRLADHPAVTRVRYPGLPTDPGHAVAERDFAGFGAVLSFEVADLATADTLCARLQLITHATSLGGVESLIERRAMHAVDAAFGTPPGLLRLSVGIENIEDLWADLTQALP